MLGRRGARSRRGWRSRLLPLLLVALLPGVTSCTDDEQDAVDSPPVVLDQSGAAQEDGSPEAPARGADSLVLEFSGADDGLLVNTGDRHLRVSLVTSGAGDVVATSDAPDGTALRFPRYDPAGQDFAIIRIISRGTDDLLSPGPRDFVFGADVALDDVTTGTSADNGDNLVQRGLYQSSSQYKIQVDDGVVSCRVAGVLGELVVYAPGRLEPGDWHRIRCQRDRNTLTLAVARLTPSGPQHWLSRTSSGRIGPVLMAATVPLSVGGKLSWSGDLLPSSTDQFNGRVDRVYYHRG